MTTKGAVFLLFLCSVLLCTLWNALVCLHTLLYASKRLWTLKNTLFLFILSHSFLSIGVTSSFVRALKSSAAAKGVGRHRQGGMLPPWPENSFILTVEATKNRGWAPWKLKNGRGALPWSPREPSPGKIPAYALVRRDSFTKHANIAVIGKPYTEQRKPNLSASVIAKYVHVPILRVSFLNRGLVSRTRAWDLNPAPLEEESIALPTELKEIPKLWQSKQML